MKKTLAFLFGLALALTLSGLSVPPLVSLTVIKKPTPASCAGVVEAPAPKCECEKNEFPPTDLIVGDQYVYSMNGHKIQRFAIQGYIGAKTRDQLVVALESTGKAGVTDIELMIDSLGGEADAGFQMAALLSTSTPVVHCLVTQAAKSASFVLLQGCDDRASLESSQFMEHRPFLYVVAAGAHFSAEELRSRSDELIASRQLMADVLAARSLVTLGAEYALSVDEVAHRLSDGDWEMTAAEAKAFGLLDRIVSDMETFQYSIESI